MCKRMKFFAFSLLLMTLFIKLNAQITIGSVEPPIPGALLDLKENADGSSTKGLGLPRLTLFDLNTLAVADVSQNEIHTGLVVYNVGCTAVEKGPYVWTGTNWIKLKPTPPISIYAGSNSYICTPNQTLSIPIKRAFDVWENFSGNNPSTGQVLDKANVNNLIGTLTATLEWEQSSTDGAGVISKTGSSYDISITGTGALAALNVKTGSEYGNALIAVRIGIGAATDPILWSWHIWIPKEDPNLADAKVYCLNGYTFMDRNLGALKAVTADAESRGLYYQWGRKDPFPGPMNWGSANPTLGYGTISYAGNAGSSERTNLQNAIQKPTEFLRKDRDWYSQNLPANQCDTFWGSKAEKSPFDPCPEGWRVPTFDNNLSPWRRSATSDAIFIASGTGYNQNNGWTFTASNYNMGYYPANGYRDQNSGGLIWVSTHVYVWMANPLLDVDTSIYAYNGHAYVFASSGRIWPKDNKEKARGMAVRCVLDK